MPLAKRVRSRLFVTREDRKIRLPMPKVGQDYKRVFSLEKGANEFSFNICIQRPGYGKVRTGEAILTPYPEKWKANTLEIDYFNPYLKSFKKIFNEDQAFSKNYEDYLKIVTRKGKGRAALLEIEKLAKENGAEWVCTTARNKDAEEFYRKCGYGDIADGKGRLWKKL